MVNSLFIINPQWQDLYYRKLYFFNWSETTLRRIPNRAFELYVVCELKLYPLYRAHRLFKSTALWLLRDGTRRHHQRINAHNQLQAPPISLCNASWAPENTRAFPVWQKLSPNRIVSFRMLTGAKDTLQFWFRIVLYINLLLCTSSWCEFFTLGWSGWQNLVIRRSGKRTNRWINIKKK